MIYLDTKMCGYDLERIGFPSVETCMAIVFESANWLIGWHASSGRDSFPGSAAKFGRYVGRVGVAASVAHVYGVTHSHRCTTTEVADELRTAAGAIGFHGPISYAVLDGQEGELVEFRRVGNGKMCEIQHATNGMVNYQKANVTPSKTRHQTVHPTSANPSPDLLYGGDENSAPIVEKVLLVNPKIGLHMVKAKRIITFNV